MTPYQTKMSADLSGPLQETPTKFAGTKFHTTSPSPKSLPIPVFTAYPADPSRLSHGGASCSSPSALQSHTKVARDLSKQRQSMTPGSRSPAAGTEPVSASVPKNIAGDTDKAGSVRKKEVFSSLSQKTVAQKIPKKNDPTQNFGSAKIRLLRRDNADRSVRPSEHAVRSDPVAIPHVLATHSSALVVSTPPSAEDDHQLDRLSSSLKHLLKIPSLA